MQPALQLSCTAVLHCCTALLGPAVLRHARAMHANHPHLLPPCVQGLPAAVGNSPPTHPPSGRALHFPELSYFETHPRHAAVRAAAAAWGKTTMLCCWMGHLTPWRPEWFSNFAHPAHWPDHCSIGGCTVPDCCGNGVKLSPDGQRYILVASHHKHSDNSSTRNQQPISYPFPPSMFVWMDVWCQFCWPIIAAQVRMAAVAAVPLYRCPSWCVLRYADPLPVGCCCAGHHYPVLHF